MNIWTVGGFDLRGSSGDVPPSFDYGQLITWGPIGPARGIVATLEPDDGEYQHVSGFLAENDNAYFIAAYAGTARAAALNAQATVNNGAHVEVGGDDTVGSSYFYVAVGSSVPIRITGEGDDQYWSLYEDHPYTVAQVLNTFSSPQPLIGRVGIPLEVTESIATDNPNYPSFNNNLIGAGLIRYDEGGGIYSLECTVAGDFCFTASFVGFNGVSASGSAWAAIQRKPLGEAWDAIDSLHYFVQCGITTAALYSAFPGSWVMIMPLEVGDRVRVACGLDDSENDDYWSSACVLSWVRGMLAPISP